MSDRYVIVTWPESQELIDKEDFEKNACLINDDTFLEIYGSQSYFVNESWLNNQV